MPDEYIVRFDSQGQQDLEAMAMCLGVNPKEFVEHVARSMLRDTPLTGVIMAHQVTQLGSGCTMMGLGMGVKMHQTPDAESAHRQILTPEERTMFDVAQRQYALNDRQVWELCMRLAQQAQEWLAEQLDIELSTLSVSLEDRVRAGLRLLRMTSPAAVDARLLRLRDRINEAGKSEDE